MFLERSTGRDAGEAADAGAGHGGTGDRRELSGTHLEFERQHNEQHNSQKGWTTIKQPMLKKNNAILRDIPTLPNPIASGGTF